MTHASRAAAISCALICVACGDSPPSSPSTKPQVAVAKAVPETRAIPARPLTPPWPVLDETTQTSGNLLAKNYYLVFDASGSMSNHSCTSDTAKLKTAKQAVASFAKSIPADANVGLLVFGANGIIERLPLAATNRQGLERTINAIQPGGGTPLKTSIQRASQALTVQGKRQLGYGEYHLVIITDGEHTPSSEAPDTVVEEILATTPIVIHTLGFCIGDQHSLNQPGRILYKAANTLQDLERGLGEVLAESTDFKVSQFK